MERACELILREKISISGKDSNDKDVYIGTTVQKKNITLSTKESVCHNRADCIRRRKSKEMSISGNSQTLNE
jgi:hypothetical protein